MKIIYTIFFLFFNFISRRKYHKLTFVADEDNGVKRWYIDLPNWGFSKDYLEMVGGADRMCEYYAKGGNKVTLDIVATKKVDIRYCKDYDFYEGLKLEGSSPIDKLLYGRTYQGVKTNKDGKMIINSFWICPVTLFVLGCYPNFLYVKQN